MLSAFLALIGGVKLRTWLALGGALAVLSSCGMANHYKTDRNKWKVRAVSAERQLKLTEAALDKSLKLRAKEQEQAVANLATVRQRCDDSMAQVRKVEAAKRSIHSRPIKWDKNSCPVREIVQAAEWGLR